MLNSLRKGAAGWAAKIMIGLLVIAFASWGVADMFNPQRNQVLATVGDEKITPSDYQEVENQIRNLYRLRSDQLQASRFFILQRLIDDRLVDVHAKDLQLGISDEKLGRDIIESRNFRDIRGKFSKNAFESFLQNMGMSEAQYISSLRQGNIRNQLRSVLAGGAGSPKQLVEAQHQYENETRVLSYFVLTAKQLDKIETPKDEDLQAYYNSNKNDFKAPEYRKVAYLHLSANILKEGIKIPEDKIKSTYETLKNKYTTPEKRKLLQISFPDLKKAEEAFEKLNSGKKFEDVAKEYNQQEKDISLGVKTRSEILDNAIAEEAFKLKKGKYSKPVKGTLNTVIVKVEEIEEAQVTPLKKVSKEIEDQLAGEKASEMVTKLQKVIEDERGEGGKLSEIGKKHGVKFQEVFVDEKGMGQDEKAVADFPASGAFLKEIFESDIGIDNEPLDVKREMIWFDVLEIKKARTKEFAEVKDSVTKRWVAEKEQELLISKSREFLEQLKKGEKIEKIAKGLSAKLNKSNPLKRTETSKDLSDSAIDQAFSKLLNEYGFAGGAEAGSRVIFQVVEIQKPKPLDDKQRKVLEEKLAENMIADMERQYLSGLRSEYNLNIRKEAVQRILGLPGGVQSN